MLKIPACLCHRWSTSRNHIGKVRSCVLDRERKRETPWKSNIDAKNGDLGRHFSPNRAILDIHGKFQEHVWKRCGKRTWSSVTCFASQVKVMFFQTLIHRWCDHLTLNPPTAAVFVRCIFVQPLHHENLVVWSAAASPRALLHYESLSTGTTGIL